MNWRYVMLALGEVETLAAAIISVFLYFVPRSSPLAEERQTPSPCSA